MAQSVPNIKRTDSKKHCDTEGPRALAMASSSVGCCRSSELSMDGNDPAGSNHCAQLGSRRYAEDVRRHMLNFCEAARAAEC